MNDRATPTPYNGAAFKEAILEAAKAAGIVLDDLHLLGETDEVEVPRITETCAIGYFPAETTFTQFAQLLEHTSRFSECQFYHEMGGGKFESRILHSGEGVRFVWDYDQERHFSAVASYPQGA